MSKELALLLCWASATSKSARAEDIEGLLSSEIDWTRLLGLARWQKLVPLLAAQLSNEWQDRIPSWVRKELQRAMGTIAMHNWVRTRELLRLMSEFERADIRAVSFKGPVLAQSAYGDWSMRQFWDLDILVHKEDVARTKDLLISDGFGLKYDLEWQSCLLKEESQTEIDLHWELTPRVFPVLLDIEVFRDSFVPIDLGGTDVRTFSREHTLLLLCVSLVSAVYTEWSNGWRNVELLKICDIAHLTGSAPGIDWQFLRSEADRIGCRTMVSFAFFLADRVVGLQLPKHVTEWLALSSSLRNRAVQVGERLLSDGDRDESAAQGREHFLFEVWDGAQAGQAYWIFTLRRSCHLLFIPTIMDESTVRLPRSLYFLYYFVRPVRLIGKYRHNVVDQFRSLVSGFDRTR